MKTESMSPRFADLDLWSTREAVAAMLEGQLAAVAAIAAVGPAIADAADAAADRLRSGAGRLVYVGAGTSGRVAVQDGVELGPTFGWPAERLHYALAGGLGATVASAEGAEDDAAAGAEAMAAGGVGLADVVIGVAASGATPYTLAALRAAGDRGALTIAAACNPDAPLLAASHHRLLLDTGPEVIAGSTRMKAGTAQKVALNLLSTAIMLRLGYVHRGLMVSMRISNQKLHKRGIRIVSELAEIDPAAAEAALAATEGDIKRAVLVGRGASLEESSRLLEAAAGNLRRALAATGA
jgi:N-acetylmuramic acid 6-phosphate etherase